MILPPRGRPRDLRPALAAAALVLAALPGCNFVPRSKIDDCQRVAQALRAENDRLKDVALDLRTQNQDLSQRAEDDGRRLALQEEAVTRLEQSVSAYQKERDQLAGAFEAMKRQVRQAATTAAPSAAAEAPAGTAPGALAAFARARPGWSFEGDPPTLAVDAGRLFEPGSHALKPEAAAELRALAEALAPAQGGAAALEIRAPGEGTEVVRAGYAAGAAPGASSRFLSAARSARVREALSGPRGLDPDRVRIAPRGGAAPDGRRVTLRFVPEAGGGRK